jgi:DNA polymerase-1
VFASADYDQGELRTLAPVCLRWLGHSKLAEVLNSGLDPHMIVAAQILGKPYDWCVTNKKSHEVSDARQTAKVANFGFPGGLGYEKLVLFARMAYHVTLTIAKAKELKAQWFAAYPEMREYFKYIERLKRADGTFSVEHLFSRRLRAGIFYCVACNSPFQGLLADAAKNAGYLIARGCYRDRESPLFGCRIVNFIHDEFIVEVPDDGPLYVKATAAANELSRLMRVGGDPFLPDVPLTADPLLMRRWSKKAKAIWVDGHLEPWDIAA